MGTTPYVGIDFGTTNSAIALAGDTDAPRLARFPTSSGGDAPTWRSILYFEPEVERREDAVSAGATAIERYLNNDGEGRLILSIKSYLASALFRKTRILNRTWTLEQLIGAFLRHARAAVSDELGARAVVGRPVRYWGAEGPEDDERAVTRMREALRLAGFTDVVFEYEPIAAALRYGHGLTREELVLIGDFGGGTSDFSVVRVGPDTQPGDTGAILATGGIGIGGDTFDGRVVDAVLSPMLGKGTSYSDEFGAEMTVPVWIYNKLRRWHHLSFLRSAKTQHLLSRIHTGAHAPEQIGNLIYIIDNDLGLSMHRAIEHSKMHLSAHERAELRFVHDELALSAQLERDPFESWIAPDLADINRVVSDVLDRAEARADRIDRVFTTGGSSFVPAIKNLLGARFGADKVSGGDELTSVAWGLAERARQLFG